MKKENLISVTQFCKLYGVEDSFVTALRDYDLIQLTTVKRTTCIDLQQLRKLEKLVHLHYELDINIEGIDVIHHLLERMESMQQELLALRNKLTRFEES